MKLKRDFEKGIGVTFFWTKESDFNFNKGTNFYLVPSCTTVQKAGVLTSWVTNRMK